MTFFFTPKPPLSIWGYIYIPLGVNNHIFLMQHIVERDEVLTEEGGLEKEFIVHVNHKNDRNKIYTK